MTLKIANYYITGRNFIFSSRQTLKFLQIIYKHHLHNIKIFCTFAKNLENWCTMDINLELPNSSAATIADRIRYLIKFMRLTQSQFAELVGVDPGYLSRVLSGRLNFSDAFANKVVANTKVSKDWLCKGTDVPFPKQATQPANIGAPVYDIDVSAGATPLSRMFTDEHIIGRMMLPGINPEYPIVRVSGNSMMPKIMPGSYISIRNVDLSAPISWGRIYVVVLADYRLVKYVRRNDNPDLLTLHSANPDYDDIEVTRSDIEALYLVEGVINHDCPA